jgi:hypothetical protein
MHPAGGSENVVLTGLPRSGTTLTCHLLNKLDDVVALHEPMSFAPFAEAPLAVAAIEEFFKRTRSEILQSGCAPTKHVGGRVPDNPVGDNAVPPTSRGKKGPGRDLRESRAERGRIAIGKPLSREFLLCVKHPSAFTALLPELTGRFRCFALVRNPLAVLGSWNSVNFPVYEGHVPAAERYVPDLAARLTSEPDRTARQLLILDWFYGQFRRHLAPQAIVRYEALVATGGGALSVVSPRAESLCEPLAERNANPLYRRGVVTQLGRRLLDSDGAWWHFYTRAEVEVVLARATAAPEGGAAPPGAAA